MWVVLGGLALGQVLYLGFTGLLAYHAALCHHELLPLFVEPLSCANTHAFAVVATVAVWLCVALALLLFIEIARRRRWAGFVVCVEVATLVLYQAASLLIGSDYPGEFRELGQQLVIFVVDALFVRVLFAVRPQPVHRIAIAGLVTVLVFGVASWALYKITPVEHSPWWVDASAGWSSSPASKPTFPGGGMLGISSEDGDCYVEAWTGRVVHPATTTAHFGTNSVYSGVQSWYAREMQQLGATPGITDDIVHFTTWKLPGGDVATLNQDNNDNHGWRTGFYFTLETAYAAHENDPCDSLRPPTGWR